MRRSPPLVEEVAIVATAKKEVEAMDVVNIHLLLMRRSNSINHTFNITIVRSMDTLLMSVEI